MCLALFQPNVSNFRSLLHYSSWSLSLSPSLHLLVVFLPCTRPSSLVLITLMSPGINFWARTRNPGARLYFRGIWSMRSIRPDFFPLPSSLTLPSRLIEEVSKSNKKSENTNSKRLLFAFDSSEEIDKYVESIFSITWRKGLINSLIKSY